MAFHTHYNVTPKDDGWEIVSKDDPDLVIFVHGDVMKMAQVFNKLEAAERLTEIKNLGY